MKHYRTLNKKHHNENTTVERSVMNNLCVCVCGGGGGEMGVEMAGMA